MNKQITGKLVSTFLLFFFLLLIADKGHAQHYPVQCHVQVIPPYSVHLADYYQGGNQKLLVNLTLKDLKRTSLDVRLKLSIEGQGIKLITKDDFIPKSPISLLPGVPELVYGDLLEEYLVPEHMNFSGITKKHFLKTGRLPEGVYKFKVEVFEARRQEKVSNTATTMAWLILNEPPVITQPSNNQIVKASDPASIFFNWLPRHMNSQNALSDVEYEFTLVEIWPVNQSVEEAIRSKEPLLKTTFRNTSFVYDAQYPALEPGRKYACRVRAFSNEQKEMFKNDGYSPVVGFVFGEKCKVPMMVDVVPALGGAAQLSIVPQSNHSSFTIQLRDVVGEKWYSQESNLPDFELKQLKLGATYQYKVQAQCGTLESDFTPLKQFSLSKEQEEVACGQSADIPEIDGSPALSELKQGDKINAGGFKVLVKKASGGSGTFTGSGVVRIGMLGNIELRTVFENIKVNESYQLTGGEIRVVGSDIYVLGGDIRDKSDDFFNDEIWETVDDAIDDAGNIIDDVTDLQKNFGDNNLNDELEIAKKKIERGRDLLAKDDPKGAQLIKEGAGKVAQILDQVNSGDYQITANGIQFLAHDNQSYGFDKHDVGLTEEEKKAYYAYYETIQLGDSTKPYFLKPWKSIASNGNDQVKVKIDLREGMKADTVLFMNSMGTKVAAQKQGDAYNLNLRGSFHEDVQELTAYYNVKDDSTKHLKKIPLGALNVISYNQIEKHLVLVPVNGNKTVIPQAQLKKYLNDTYSSANVRWTVSQHAGVQVKYSDDMSKGLDDGESKMLSNYTREMNKVIKALKRSGDYDRHKTYMFLVDKAQTANKAGFMPKKRRWGFTFTNIHYKDTKALCRTIAHEVAHGEFRLSHPFQDFPSIPERSTQNLMDYADGQQLRKYQWDDIHNLRKVELWGQSEEGNASQLWSDPICTQKFIEQFRWAFVNYEKLIYEADNYPWFGHFAKEMLLNGTTFERITVEVKQGLGFIPSKINYDQISDRAVFKYGNVLSITTQDKYSETSKYLFPSKEDWETQIEEIIGKIKSDLKLKDLLKVLAILPDSEFNRLSSKQIKICMQKLSGKAFMMVDYASCINDEEIILNIVRSCDGSIDKQRELISALKEPRAINRMLIHLDGDNLQEFVFKVAKYYSNIEKPDLHEVQRQYFNFKGQIYTKVFDWNETIGSDRIFESDNLVSTGEFKISTKYDILSIFQDAEYLMKIGAFEYVSLSAEDVLSYLPSDYVVGESVLLVPGFLFHYILGEKEFDQTLKDITTLADIGITVATMGTYAAGKTAIVIASKSAQGAIIDFGIQALFLTLDGTTWEEALNQVDYANVAWAAASIHISQSKMTYALNCIRQAYRGALKPDNESLKDAMVQAGASCLLDIGLTYISSGLVSNTDKYSKIILNKLTTNPAFVTKRLLKYGVSETAIHSFKNGITKESIKKIIDETIEEYEQEENK